MQIYITMRIESILLRETLKNSNLRWHQKIFEEFKVKINSTTILSNNQLLPLKTKSTFFLPIFKFRHKQNGLTNKPFLPINT